MTDALYRQWIQRQKSCLTGRQDWVEGEGYCEACHVRRARTSGTGWKADFCCVPMLHQEHAYQHNHGELACLRRFTRDPQLICTLDNASPFEAERIAGEWFDAQVEKYRARWAKETPEGRKWAKSRVEVMA